MVDIRVVHSSGPAMATNGHEYEWAQQCADDESSPSALSTGGYPSLIHRACGRRDSPASKWTTDIYLQAMARARTRSKELCHSRQCSAPPLIRPPLDGVSTALLHCVAEHDVRDSEVQSMLSPCCIGTRRGTQAVYQRPCLSCIGKQKHWQQ
ncbi:hypothetical protein DAEQUDRAFT_354027 [Daedalea quercina L-15889]|uniref:Uncharacterized protein n=1 Tax=Daedalea quercina L-15889 TaxID=1314783 RepID=A0A165TQ80_9APHY|nr:hypothetical protein DAEQUDRAFT_354027 [Daedalea quercina L-15889]